MWKCETDRLVDSHSIAKRNMVANSSYCSPFFNVRLGSWMMWYGCGDYATLYCTDHVDRRHGEAEGRRGLLWVYKDWLVEIPFQQPRICSRTLVGGTPSVFSRGGSLPPFIHADARHIDAVVVSQASIFSGHLKRCGSWHPQTSCLHPTRRT